MPKKSNKKKQVKQNDEPKKNRFWKFVKVTGVVLVVAVVATGVATLVLAFVDTDLLVNTIQKIKS